MDEPRSLRILVSLLILLALESCSSAQTVPSGKIGVDSKQMSLPQSRLIQPTQNPPPAFQAITLLPNPTSTQQATLAPTPQPSNFSNLISWPAPTAPLPTEYVIRGISGHRQLLAIDCEAAAAVDWASYFGVKIDERLFQSELPISDNPDYGCVGNVNDPWGELPPLGYGVYAGPVADLLSAYGLPAKAYKGYTLDQLKAKVSRGIPVIAWVVGSVERGSPHIYADPEGRKIVVAAYEHVVIVIGYTDVRIRYLSEGAVHYAATEVFLQSWGDLGNMVVVDR